MASSASSSSSSSVKSPKQLRNKEMRDFLVNIRDGWSNSVKLARKMGNSTSWSMAVSQEDYDKMGPLAQNFLKKEGDQYTATIYSKDLTKLVQKLRTETVSGIMTQHRSLNKRSAGVNIGGFGNPLKLKQEMANFLRTAPILSDLVSRLTYVKDADNKGSASRVILTSLLSAYAYDKNNQERPPLAFFATTNKENLEYLTNLSKRTGRYMKLIGSKTKNADKTYTYKINESTTPAVLDAKQQSILETLSKKQVPAVSYKAIMEALDKIGVSADKPRIPLNTGGSVKPINGQVLGIDNDMANALKGILVNVENYVNTTRDKYGRVRKFDANNMNSGTLQIIASNAVDTSVKYPIEDAAKDLYKRLVVAPSRAFSAAYQKAKKVIDKPGRNQADSQKALNEYNIAAAASANPDYRQLAQDQRFAKYPNAQRRIMNDFELVQIKLDSLRRSAKFNHNITFQ